MKAYSYESYRCKNFVDKKLSDINNKVVTKVSIMFNEIENISDKKYDTKRSKRAYFAKALKNTLEHELYNDIKLSQIKDVNVRKSLKDELFGYLKFRVTQYNKK
jgi:hypothetical protein